MARDNTYTRRTVFRTGSTVAIAGLLAGCTGGDSGSANGGGGGQGTTTGGGASTETATGTSTTAAETTGTGTGSSTTGGGTGSADLDSWFSDVDNYDGVTDATGQDQVSVTVGVEGNGGYYAFEPAAVRISTGTSVVWEWTGQGGSHNVAAEDGSFESELAQDAGHMFEHTFESTGTYTYVCTPHESLGMKGAVVAE